MKLINVLIEPVVAMVEKRTEKAKADRKRIKAETGKDYTSFRDKVLVPRTDGLANCVTACLGKNMQVRTCSGQIRYLHPFECEFLQGMNPGYTLYPDKLSNTQRYKMIGNGFTVPVIAYILKQSQLASHEVKLI